MWTDDIARRKVSRAITQGEMRVGINQATAVVQRIQTFKITALANGAHDQITGDLVFSIGVGTPWSTSQYGAPFLIEQHLQRHDTVVDVHTGNCIMYFVFSRRHISL